MARAEHSSVTRCSFRINERRSLTFFRYSLPGRMVLCVAQRGGRLFFEWEALELPDMLPGATDGRGVKLALFTAR
jgi:hypothetical protein